VNVNFCAADNFVRARNATNLEKVTTWIQLSGYDHTKPLRAEVGCAKDSLIFFSDEHCIPVAEEVEEEIEQMFRVFDGAHRLGACRKLQGRRTMF
jgi:hypothetical protein